MATPVSENNRFEGRFYPLESFDKHLCLKPPPGLIASLFFLCRDFLFALIARIGSLKGGQGIDTGILISHEHKFVLVAGMLPALLVVWAYLSRVPNAGRMTRRVWNNGVWLLGTAAAIQSVPAVLALWRQDGSGAFSESPWFLVFTVAVLAYLFLSKRVRDVFADFPQA